MDVGTVVNWIQVAIWVVAVIAFIVRFLRGEENMPAFLKNNVFIGIVIVLGICGSVASVYLHYAHPKVVIVEKPVDRFVDRVVEKRVLVPCPKPSAPVGKQEPKKTEQTQAQQATPLREVVNECPPGVSSYDIANITANDNGVCGVEIEGDVCVIIRGKTILERNMKSGMCIDANGNRVPKPKQ